MAGRSRTIGGFRGRSLVAPTHIDSDHWQYGIDVVPLLVRILAPESGSAPDAFADSYVRCGIPRRAIWDAAPRSPMGTAVTSNQIIVSSGCTAGGGLTPVITFTSLTCDFSLADLQPARAISYGEVRVSTARDRAPVPPPPCAVIGARTSIIGGETAFLIRRAY